jgi:hypothetical protein
MSRTIVLLRLSFSRNCYQYFVPELVWSHCNKCWWMGLDCEFPRDIILSSFLLLPSPSVHLLSWARCSYTYYTYSDCCLMDCDIVESGNLKQMGLINEIWCNKFYKFSSHYNFVTYEKNITDAAWITTFIFAPILHVNKPTHHPKV